MNGKRMFRNGMVALSALLAWAAEVHALDLSKVPASDWIQLFNGKDLNGWVPKVAGTAAGQDPDDTWYVKDGLLWVDYKNYGGQFNNRFGHMAYEKRKFSYYLFHVESNHWGTQVSGGPDWGFQNNGVMFHSQSMESMGVDQQFPTSVEFQLLGENNHLNSDKKTGNGTTGNLCGNSSNTSMIVGGTRQSPGCLNVKHVQIDSSHWVVTEGLVLGDSLVKHMVAGDTGRAMDTVITYTALQTKGDGKPLKEGYIAIQGESSPWKFRTIEVLDLEGCTDPGFANYRSYFIKSNPSLCSGTVGIRDGRPLQGVTLGILPGGMAITVPDRGGFHMRIAGADGRLRKEERLEGSREYRIALRGLQAGLYFADLSRGGKSFRKAFTLMEPAGR